MGKKIIYSILIGLTIIIMSLPIIQMLTNIIDTTPLNGVTHKQEKPVFSYSDWFNSKYQRKLYKYLVENYGFREFTIRLYNQIHFDLYSKGNSNVTVGIDEYLYEPWFINKFSGKSYLGEEKILEKINKIQFIQDTLNKLNKELVIFLTPGKVSYWPEYVPKKAIRFGNPTNYKTYTKKLSESSIKYIDGNSWFAQSKDTSQYPLFPKTGTHWSYYGAAIAYDSILRFIDYKSDFSLAKTNLTNIIPTNELVHQDKDLERILNLFYPLKTLDMIYPIMTYDRHEKYDKPNIVVISDSFFWNILSKLPTKKKIFNKLQYWYYNKRVYGFDNKKKDILAANLNFHEVLKETDIFLLMACPHTLDKFGWGFIDRAYNFFTNKQEPIPVTDKEKEKRIQALIKYIKTDKKWLKNVSKKAMKLNIPLDSMIKRDATFYVNQKIRQNK